MSSNIVTVAGVMLDIAIAILLVRLAREVTMRERTEQNWLAFSDWLAVFAALLTFTVMVLVLLEPQPGKFLRFQRPMVVAATILIVGYGPAILAHYRFLGGAKASGPRRNPEPLEAIVVPLCAVVAATVGLFVFFVT